MEKKSSQAVTETRLFTPVLATVSELRRTGHGEDWRNLPRTDLRRRQQVGHQGLEGCLAISPGNQRMSVRQKCNENRGYSQRQEELYCTSVSSMIIFSKSCMSCQSYQPNHSSWGGLHTNTPKAMKPETSPTERSTMMAASSILISPSVAVRITHKTLRALHPQSLSRRREKKKDQS